MATPDFSPILDSDIALGTAIRRTFGTKTKDSLDNLNFRIKGLEGPARFFTHFNANAGALNKASIASEIQGFVGSDAKVLVDVNGWMVQGGSRAAETFVGAASGFEKVSYSELGMQANVSIPGDGWHCMRYGRPFLPDRTTLPIIFALRGRWDDSRFPTGGTPIFTDEAPQVGMKIWDANLNNPDNSGAAGVWLQRGGTDLWRFRMRDSSGVSTIGINTFARPTNNTDFEIKIEITNDPTNRVICSADNGDGAGLVLRETFLDNLPFDSILFAQIGMENTTHGGPGRIRCSFDWLEYSAGDVLDANP